MASVGRSIPYGYCQIEDQVEIMMLSTHRLHLDLRCRHLTQARDILFTAGDFNDEASGWPSIDSEEGYCSAFAPVLIAGRRDDIGFDL